MANDKQKVRQILDSVKSAGRSAPNSSTSSGLTSTPRFSFVSG